MIIVLILVKAKITQFLINAAGSAKLNICLNLLCQQMRSHRLLTNNGKIISYNFEISLIKKLFLIKILNKNRYIS